MSYYYSNLGCYITGYTEIVIMQENNSQRDTQWHLAGSRNSSYNSVTTTYKLNWFQIFWQLHCAKSCIRSAHNVSSINLLLAESEALADETVELSVTNFLDVLRTNHDVAHVHITIGFSVVLVVQAQPQETLLLPVLFQRSSRRNSRNKISTAERNALNRGTFERITFLLPLSRWKTEDSRSFLRT